MVNASERESCFSCNPLHPTIVTDSFAKVKSQLKLKSAMYKKADELASKLSPDEINAYKAWTRLRSC
jgi:hypothetical protein